MKVKTKLYLCATISIGLMTILVFVVLLTSNRIAEERRKHEFAHDVQQAVSELDIVLYEYLMHRETRMKQQWNLKYNSIMSILIESESGLEKREGEEVELLESIEVSFITLGDLFTQVSVNYEKIQNLIQEGASQKKIDAAMLLEERLVARLLIASQLIFTNTSRLVENVAANAKVAQELARNSTIILTAVVVVVITTSLLLVTGSISKSLDKLINGAEIIGRGNLKHRISIKIKDEIGNLADVFNIMTAKLEESYESLERKIEELKELDELKDDFLNTTTHELKTPLVPIKSQTQLLLAGDYGKINKEQKEALKMIFRNEEQLKRLVDDVLDITKIESRRLKLVLENRDFGEIITNAVKNIERIAREKGIFLTLKPIPEMPKISIDRKRILQVFSNLLGNALKFTLERGKIEVEVQKKENSFVVSIKDTGIGMSKKTLEKLFTPFFQAKSDIARKYPGTGLGLSICKGIIEAHGGKIWAESLGEEKGSVFTFTLPIAKQ